MDTTWAAAAPTPATETPVAALDLSRTVLPGAAGASVTVGKLEGQGQAPAVHDPAASRSWWPKQELCLAPASRGGLQAASPAVDTGWSAQQSQTKPGTHPASMDSEDEVTLTALAELLSGSSAAQQPPAAVAALKVVHQQLGGTLVAPSTTLPVSSPAATACLAPILSFANHPSTKQTKLVTASELWQGSPGHVLGCATPPSSVGCEYPGWLQQGAVQCVAVFLTSTSREVLCSMVLPRYAHVLADGMLLAWDPSVPEALGYPLGAEVTLQVTAQASDGKAQAVISNPPAWLPPPSTSLSYITLSLAPGAAVTDVSSMLAAALGISGDSTQQLGAAAVQYEHLAEPLPLVGHVGVQLRDGRRLFSAGQLAEAGLLTWGTPQQQRYRQQHADLVLKHHLALPDIPLGSCLRDVAAPVAPDSLPVTPRQLPPSTPDTSSPDWTNSSPLRGASTVPCAAPTPLQQTSTWPPGIPVPTAATSAVSAAASAPTPVAVSAAVALPVRPSPAGTCTPPQDASSSAPTLPPMLPFSLPAAAVPASRAPTPVAAPVSGASGAAPGAALPGPALPWAPAVTPTPAGLNPVAGLQAASPALSSSPAGVSSAAAMAALPPFLQLAASRRPGGAAGAAATAAGSLAAAGVPPVGLPALQPGPIRLASSSSVEGSSSSSGRDSNGSSSSGVVSAGGTPLAAAASSKLPVLPFATSHPAPAAVPVPAAMLPPVMAAAVTGAGSAGEELSHLVALLSTAGASARPAAPTSAVAAAALPTTSPAAGGGASAAVCAPVSSASGKGPAAAVAAEEEDAVSVADTLDSSTSAASDMPVMQRAQVHVGDYVLVEPWLGGMEAAADGSSSSSSGALLEGWVKDHASDETWQPEGVLVVLGDNTLGHVLRLLDAPHLAPSIPPTTTRTAGRTAKPKRTRSGAAPSADGILDQLTQGSSVLAGHGLRPISAGGRGSSGVEAAASVAALYQRFMALQKRFGEAMCEGVLAACGHDFQAACEELEGQQQLLEEGGAAADTRIDAAVSSSSWADGSSDASWHGCTTPTKVAAPSQATPAAAAPLAPVPPAVSLKQLALQQGVDPAAAEKLSSMLDGLEPGAVVAALAAKQGDVNAAAEALLSGEPLLPADGQEGSSSSSSRAQGEEEVPDPALEQGAALLQRMHPQLDAEAVQALLQLHGGSLEEAARDLQQQLHHGSSSSSSSSSSSGSPSFGSLLSEAALQQRRQFERLTQPQPPPLQQQQQLSSASGSPPRAAGTTLSARAMNGQRGGAVMAAYMAMGEEEEEEEQQQLASARRPAAPPAAAVRAAAGAGYQQHQVVRAPPAKVSGAALGGAGSGGAGAGGPGQRGLTEADKQHARNTVDDLRRQADKAYEAHRIYLAAYQQAQGEGQEAKASQLLAQSKAMLSKGKALTSEANKAAWMAHNRVIRNSWEVDLHLMGAQPAMEKLMQQLSLIEAMDSPGGVLVKVITGKGRHSADGVAAIRNRVTAYLEDAGFEHTIDPDNAGVVLVHIPAKTADANQH